MVLLPCSSVITTNCFTANANGTLTIPSMPSRSSAAAVTVTVVTQGVAGAAAYTYTSAPAAPTAPTATAGATSATVTWTAPSPNGSPITGYVVTPYLNGVAQPPVSYRAHRDHADAHRADGRGLLHLHRHGGERRRDRGGEPAVGRGGALHRAGPPDDHRRRPPETCRPR